jgi:hypothetical protein
MLETPTSRRRLSPSLDQAPQQKVAKLATTPSLDNDKLDDEELAEPAARRDSSAKKDRCTYCCKVFTNRSNLIVHLRSHTGK